MSRPILRTLAEIYLTPRDLDPRPSKLVRSCSIRIAITATWMEALFKRNNRLLAILRWASSPSLATGSDLKTWGQRRAIFQRAGAREPRLSGRLDTAKLPT